MSDAIERLKPRYIWGDISPRESKVQRGPAYQFYKLVPNDVMLVVAPLGIKDYTNDRVEEAITAFDDRVSALAREKANHLILGGAPVSAQLGRDRVQRLLRDAEDRTGIPGDGPIEAIIARMYASGREAQKRAALEVR